MKYIKKILRKLYSIFRNLRYLRYRHRYELSNSFGFNGGGTILYGEGQIIAGDRSYVGRFCSIQAAKGFMVKIGKGVSISHFVKIYTQNSDPDQDFSNKGKKGFKLNQGNVIIEDYVWIGAGVFIKEGVHIGENSIIGANSVVTNDIPPYSIAGGIPARVIRKKKID